MKIRSTMLLAIALLLFALQVDVQAQEETDPAQVISVESQLVLVDVGAADQNGRILTGLKPDDFSIYQDGRRQELAYFARGSTPFDLVVVMDTSGSTRMAREVMEVVLDDLTYKLKACNIAGAPPNRVALVQFGQRTRVIQELTTNYPLFKQGFWTAWNCEDNSGSSVYDALIFAAELLAKSDRRKAILMLSDGVDSSSEHDFEQARAALAAANLNCYFIGFDTEKYVENFVKRPDDDPLRVSFTEKQLQRYLVRFPTNNLAARLKTPDAVELRCRVNSGLYQIARTEMGALAAANGGRVFIHDSISGLIGQLRSALDELRALYSLGFYPDDDETERNWHAIEIRSSMPGARLNHRRGYQR